MVIPRVTSDVNSAICLVTRSRAARAALGGVAGPGLALGGVAGPGLAESSELATGMIAITSAPARGIAPMTVSQGNELMRLDPHQQEGADEQHRTDEHGQGVGADEPGLDPPQPPRGAAHGSGERIDQAVHAP